MKVINDLQHILWLTKQMIKHWLNGNNAGALDAWEWIKFHWNYESLRLK